MPQISPTEFSKLEYEGWERVAGKYMQHWANLTKEFIDPLLDAAAIGKNMKVLDVACGPGIGSERISRRGSVPVGIDFSPEMIGLARKLYPHIEFFVADAQLLPFDDASFDAVVMNFGMLHLPEPLQAMKEAHRVLQQNGSFAFTVWAGLEGNPASKIINDAKEKFADMHVSMPASLAYDYFKDREICRSFLNDAGFNPHTMVYQTKVVTWTVPTAGYLFDAELNAGVRNAAFLRQQSPEVLKKIRDTTEQGMQQFKADEGYDLPFTACIIAARKP